MADALCQSSGGPAGPEHGPPGAIADAMGVQETLCTLLTSAAAAVTSTTAPLPPHPRVSAAVGSGASAADGARAHRLSAAHAVDYQVRRRPGRGRARMRRACWEHARAAARPRRARPRVAWRARGARQVVRAWRAHRAAVAQAPRRPRQRAAAPPPPLRVRCSCSSARPAAARRSGRRSSRAAVGRAPCRPPPPTAALPALPSLPQLVAKWVEGMLPFLALLAIAFAYHFCTSIFLCVWLTCSVHKANDVIRKVVGQAAREPSELAAVVIFVAANVGLTLALAGAPQLRALLLLPLPGGGAAAAPAAAGAAAGVAAAAPPLLGFWQVLFRVAITDTLVRCCGVIPKLLIAAATMLPRPGGGGVARRLSADGGCAPRRASGDGVQRRMSEPLSIGASPPAAAAEVAGPGPATAAAAAAGASASASPPLSPSGGCRSPGRRPGAGAPSGSGVPAASGGCGGLVTSRSCCLGGGAGGCGAPPGGLAARRSVDLGALASASASSSASASASGSPRAPLAPGAAAAVRGACGGAPCPAAAAAAPPPPGGLARQPSGRLLALPAGHGSAASYAAVCARRRARLLALYESVQATYRAVLPVPLWYSYFLSTSPNALLGTLLAASYLTFKAYALSRRGRLLLLATRIVLRTGALYGRYLTKAEAAAGGPDLSCPICMQQCAAPIRLDCSHVFCEDCLAEWLEREPTCPMVRSARARVCVGGWEARVWEGGMGGPPHGPLLRRRACARR
jgi:hypothetical protein